MSLEHHLAVVKEIKRLLKPRRNRIRPWWKQTPSSYKVVKAPGNPMKQYILKQGVKP